MSEFNPSDPNKVPNQSANGVSEESKIKNEKPGEYGEGEMHLADDRVKHMKETGTISPIGLHWLLQVRSDKEKYIDEVRKDV